MKIIEWLERNGSWKRTQKAAKNCFSCLQKEFANLSVLLVFKKFSSVLPFSFAFAIHVIKIIL